MNKKLALIIKRREQIVERIANQRMALAQHTAPWRAPLTLIDRGLAALRYIKQHSILAVGATALFGMLRPTPASTWLQSGWATFLAVRKLRSWLLKS